MNRFGRGGKPFGGYPSVSAFRKARREERKAEVQQRIEWIEEAERRRDQHFSGWLKDCCVLAAELGTDIEIECDVTRLLASYLAWCAGAGVEPRTKQAWGRWMGDRFVRLRRNARGAGTVYTDVGLRSGATPGQAETRHHAPDDDFIS